MDLNAESLYLCGFSAFPLFYDNEIRHRLSCIIADIFNKKEELLI